MKKVLILFFIFCLFSFPVFAEEKEEVVIEKYGYIQNIKTSEKEAYENEITVTDDGEILEFKTDNFTPKEVTDALTDAKIDVSGENTAKNVLGFVLSGIKSTFKGYSEKIGVLLGIIVIMSIIYRITDNKPYKVIISYISILIILIEIFDIIRNILNTSYQAVTSLSEILNAVLPAFSAILLMGGSTFTVIAESASFAAVLALLQFVLSSVLLPLITVMMLIMMFEKLSPLLSELNLLRFLKKNTLTLFSFVTMIMLTVISYQHIVSAGKDSVSGRTVKFAAANFIPIVGSALGESFKTLSAGLKYLKNTVGGAVILSVLVTILPVLLQIFLLKLLFNFLGFISGVLGCKNEQAVFGDSVSVLDILNGIIICISVLSILLIITFILSVFSVSL